MLSSTFLDMQKMPSDSTKVVFTIIIFFFWDVLLILQPVCKSNNSVWMGGGDCYSFKVKSAKRSLAIFSLKMSKL